MIRFLLFVTLFAFASTVFSQDNLWRENSDNQYASLVGYQIPTTASTSFYFDIEAFKEIVSKNPSEILLALPVGENEFVDFSLTINTTMSEGLMESFPAIRAFDGIARDQSGRTAKVDVGPNYFRAMILTPGGMDLFIDPAVFTNDLQTAYILYGRNDIIATKDWECGVEGQNDDKLLEVDFSVEKGIQSCELRTYRIAIAATGEYTIFHGGTVANALAAQVTTMNRVNGLYERDLAITMTIVPNNELIIFTDPETDPYTNGSPGNMIAENTGVINDAIGNSNYDIGHVFGTNSGGLASLNSVCHSNKARGVTGSGAPIGDPFDIDYVAHEVGHQFGADHTFNNSCSGNRNNATAMEPGSGSTILAYAGICPPNVQNNSDGLFHAISLQQIGLAVSHYSHTCATKTPLINLAPVITSTTGDIHVPASTPFTLSATATDLDGDVLTYTFDQMNREISTQQPVATSAKGPNFRVMLPSTENYRNFPSITNIITSSYNWERLASVSRTFKFRATVRDNSPGGGCTDYQDITVSVDENAGPLAVLYPSAYGIVWTGLTQRTITWDVANTNSAPVSCENVEILLSTDWGVTFETFIASTPNTGSLEITVPNIQVERAMIMVRAENGTFFDISDYTFKINMSSVGIEENMMENITLYPNPTDGNVQVNLNSIEQLDGFRILSTSGQVVMESTQKVVESTTIDISRLESGVYFFEASLGQKKSVFKLIKN